MGSFQGVRQKWTSVKEQPNILVWDQLSNLFHSLMIHFHEEPGRYIKRLKRFRTFIHTLKKLPNKYCPLKCTPYLVKFMSYSRLPPRIIFSKTVFKKLQETMLRLNNLFQRDILWERAEVESTPRRKHFFCRKSFFYFCRKTFPDLCRNLF